MQEYLAFGFEVRGKRRPNPRTEILYITETGTIARETSLIHCFTKFRNKIVLADKLDKVWFDAVGAQAVVKPPEGFLSHPVFLEYRLTDALGFSAIDFVASLKDKVTNDGYWESLHAFKDPYSEGNLLKAGFGAHERSKHLLAHAGKSMLFLTTAKYTG